MQEDNRLLDAVYFSNLRVAEESSIDNTVAKTTNKKKMGTLTETVENYKSFSNKGAP